MTARMQTLSTHTSAATSPRGLESWWSPRPIPLQSSPRCTPTLKAGDSITEPWPTTKFAKMARSLSGNCQAIGTTTFDCANESMLQFRDLCLLFTLAILTCVYTYTHTNTYVHAHADTCTNSHVYTACSLSTWSHTFHARCWPHTELSLLPCRSHKLTHIYGNDTIMSAQEQSCDLLHLSCITNLFLSAGPHQASQGNDVFVVGCMIHA